MGLASEGPAGVRGAGGLGQQPPGHLVPRAALLCGLREEQIPFWASVSL